MSIGTPVIPRSAATRDLEVERLRSRGLTSRSLASLGMTRGHLRPAQNLRRTNGFTLIELILVMLLLTIIVGTAMPSVRGFLGWSRSRDAIAQIIAMTQYAKSKAAA